MSLQVVNALAPLTSCSDDPAVGVLGGRDETGRREELKAKEPHCYCMMNDIIRSDGPLKIDMSLSCSHGADMPV